MYGRKNPSTEYRSMRKEKVFQQISVKDYLHPKPLTLKQKAIHKKRLERFKRDMAKAEKEKKTKKQPLNRVNRNDQLLMKWSKRLGWKKPPARCVIKSYTLSKVKKVKST
jgi:hypothetical protein